MEGFGQPPTFSPISNPYSSPITLSLARHLPSPGTPYLPPAVQAALDELGIVFFDFSWVVSDISALAPQCGLTLNLSHHAWYFPEELFPEVIAGRRIEVSG